MDRKTTGDLGCFNNIVSHSYYHIFWNVLERIESTGLVNMFLLLESQREENLEVRPSDLAIN